VTTGLNHLHSFSTKFLQLWHFIMSQPMLLGAQLAEYGIIVLQGRLWRIEIAERGITEQSMVTIDDHNLKLSVICSRSFVGLFW
jgi:hypothetical protein